MMVGMATAVGEDRIRWFDRLPLMIKDIADRWSLRIGLPFRPVEDGCAWVAPVRTPDHQDAVLKISFPHFEEEHEIAGLRFWDGEPTVRLYCADDELHA